MPPAVVSAAVAAAAAAAAAAVIEEATAAELRSKRKHTVQESRSRTKSSTDHSIAKARYVAIVDDPTDSSLTVQSHKGGLCKKFHTWMEYPFLRYCFLEMHGMHILDNDDLDKKLSYTSWLDEEGLAAAAKDLDPIVAGVKKEIDGKDTVEYLGVSHNHIIACMVVEKIEERYPDYGKPFLAVVKLATLKECLDTKRKRTVAFLKDNFHHIFLCNATQLRGFGLEALPAYPDHTVLDHYYQVLNHDLVGWHRMQTTPPMELVCLFDDKTQRNAGYKGQKVPHVIVPMFGGDSRTLREIYDLLCQQLRREWPNPELVMTKASYLEGTPPGEGEGPRGLVLKKLRGHGGDDLLRLVKQVTGEVTLTNFLTGEPIVRDVYFPVLDQAGDPNYVFYTAEPYCKQLQQGEIRMYGYIQTAKGKFKLTFKTIYMMRTKENGRGLVVVSKPFSDVFDDDEKSMLKNIGTHVCHELKLKCPRINWNNHRFQMLRIDCFRFDVDGWKHPYVNSVKLSNLSLSFIGDVHKAEDLLQWTTEANFRNLQIVCGLPAEDWLKTKEEAAEDAAKEATNAAAKKRRLSLEKCSS